MQLVGYLALGRLRHTRHAFDGDAPQAIAWGVGQAALAHLVDAVGHLHSDAPGGEPSETVIAVDRVVTNRLKAVADYEDLAQEQVDHIVKKASVAALDQHTALARLAVEETGRGVFEDKAAKNMFACEHVTHSMGRMKTVGVIARDDIEDMVEIAERHLLETPGEGSPEVIARLQEAPPPCAPSGARSGGRPARPVPGTAGTPPIQRSAQGSSTNSRRYLPDPSHSHRQLSP